MDCSEDMREPWERAEEEELAGFSSVAAEHEFWCPDDGHTAGNDEPTAVNDEPCAREVKLPLAPATPAGAEQQAETPGSSSKKRSCEGGDSESHETSPGALIPAAEPPKRIRYRAKTPAPPEVGPTLVLTLPEDYTEEFVSKKVWPRTHHQTYCFQPLGRIIKIILPNLRSGPKIAPRFRARNRDA